MDRLPFSLTLRYTGRTPERAEAWLVPGSRPAEWLAELSRWGIALSKVRLLIVPTSGANREAVGALVLTAGERPHVSTVAQPYVCRAGRLYHPADADLFPAVTDEELRTQLVTDIAVLHPSAGLVGAPANECLTVAALLTAGPDRLANWSRAREGEPVRDRIESVLPDIQLTVDAILQSDRGDIGQSPMDLPSQFPGQGLARSAADFLRKLAARAAASGASGSAGGAAGSSFLQTLGGWAANLANLQALRNQQLRQLMQMLEADPDRALRFALPLSGDAGRGSAQAGAFLSPRDINFDLNRLMQGGGGAADAWMAPPEVFQALYQRYRSLAEREMHLGRHRRAAYIYAELLGDFPSAVAALKQGKHYRDAAILYRDRLQNPLEAAKCFVEGGFLQEAVTLYEERQLFERAGDLWVRLERPDRAEACFRKAVGQLVQAGNTIQAAQLLEKKLAVPDEALALLAEAWPPKCTCLKEHFDLLGRLGRHEEAHSLVAMARGKTIPPALRIELAATLAEVVNTYPQQETRTRAANAARIVAAEALSTTLATAELERVVRVVTSLAPEDRLLRRDGDRFKDQRRARTVPPRPTGKPQTPRLETEFTLPGRLAWTTAATGSGKLYAAGYGRFGPAVVRCRWDDQFDFTDWATDWKSPKTNLVITTDNQVALEELVRRAEEAPPLLFALGYHGHVLYPMGHPLPKRTLHQRGRGTEAFSTPEWFPQNVIGFATSTSDLIWVVRVTDNGPLVLSLYRQNGALLATQGLFDPAATAPVPVDEESADITDTVWDLSALLTGREPLPITCRNTGAYLGLGNTLMKVGHGVAPVSLTLKHRILSVTASYGTMLRRVAVAFEYGGALINAETMEVETEFLTAAPRPSIGFTHDDRFVAVSDNVGVVISQNRRHTVWTPPKHAHRLPELLPTARADGFGLISLEGQVQCFVIEG